MKLINYLHTILLVLCMCSFVKNETRPITWAKEISIPHLQNTFLVTNEIYRGAQPSKQGFHSLDSIGIKSVLNLRNILNDNKEAKHSKQQLIHLKINTWTINYKKLVEGVRLLHQAPKPVFVHCKHGSDRTGCIVAGYRIAIQDWTFDDAIDEFRNGGFGFHEIWFQNIIKLLKSIDKTKFKQDVLSQK